MVSRLPRLWQPGAPQRRVFLPEFWVAVERGDTIGRMRTPKNCVVFEVDPRMSRHDVREYLTKIYDLPVRDVRIMVRQGEIQWQNKADHQYKRAMWKEEDQKVAYVFMKKDFEFTWPPMFTENDELDEVIKAQREKDKMKINQKFAASDRKGVAEFLP